MERKEVLAKIMESIGKMHRFGGGHQGLDAAHKMPTRSQVCIMMILMQEGGKSIKDLAKQFSMTSSAATQLVDGLVKDKLLIRQMDKEDRRKISVSLTAEGRKKLLMAKKARFKAMSKYFEALNDKELQELQKLLGKIVEHFNNYEKN